MAFLRITGITLQETPRLESITHIHGAFGTKAREQVIDEIRKNINSFYTKSPFATGTTKVEVHVSRFGLIANALLGRAAGGHLRSEPNLAKTDNLLSLPRLPPPATPSMSGLASAFRR